MANKESSSTPPVVVLAPNEYKEYLHLTQATKSASISFVFQTGIASACFSHSSGPWIFYSGESNHLSDNKDFFLPLLLHHLYP